ncbi:MAG: hypothetical protein JSS86_11655 [Cyanobacteria bacterium SZAS LIN-2]|nr:hypothetical protein [Cyanobacteria bacterium SZAS LIN-2]MBS2009347.1 hypothetical protein [Cyanobacteria bacterium SZAS TMP-1]
MDFIIALICNLVFLGCGAFGFLAFNAAGGIFSSKSKGGTAIFLAIAVPVIAGLVSYHFLAGTGVTATVTAFVLLVAFIIFKPIAWLKNRK